jgi:hypothetical protein
MTVDERIKQLVSEIEKLSSFCLPNYSVKIDYLTIFAQDETDYKSLNNYLGSVGPKDTANNGIKYHLITPMKISNQTIETIRVRKPDIHRKEYGCADVSISNIKYVALRTLALEKNWDVILRKGYEMIELSTFDINAYAYVIKSL